MDHSYENEKDAVVSDAERGNPADAVQGRKEAEEDIEEAEKAADEELQHLDQPGNTLEVDPAVDQTDSFRNPSE